ncbi:MAG: SDR family oxidoreductase [Candidatus Margulisiibacteriota bacterium]
MSALNLKGKIALVSGGSRGIGRAITDELLGQGAKVFVTGNEPEPSWYKGVKGIDYRPVDLLDDRSIKQLLAELEGLERIDILVNSAGIHIPKSLFELNDNDWAKVLGVNLLGAMKLMRFVGIKMKQAKNGRILNISSIAGIVSKSTSSAYSASKSGLIGLTRASALELAPYNVLVNALCPGTTMTDMTKESLSKEQIESIELGVPLGRLARPEEIARFALFLCSDMNTYITGQTIVVDGGTIIK